MSEYSIKDDYEEKSTQLEKHPWGTFPFHSGNFWHSGIHLLTNGKKFSPILNGKVVAYRLRDKEKEVDFAESISEVEYKALDRKCATLYNSNYILRDKQTAPKKKVSDSFILLKHEINRYNPSLVFYSLYMNLGPISKDELKYYPGIKETLNKTVICNPELDSISFIPNGFKNYGNEYIDYCIFTKSEDILMSHKINEKLFIFKNIPITEQILVGNLRTDIKPIADKKYLVPNDSDYIKKKISTDGKNRAVEIELKSYNAMVKIIEEKGKRRLSWVSASNYKEDGIKRDFSRPKSDDKAEGLQYIIDLLKNSAFIAKCEAKNSVYRTTPKDNLKPDERTNIIFNDIEAKEKVSFWTKEITHFSDEIGVEGKTSCYDGNHAYFIFDKVYDENPFQYSFKEICKNELSDEDFEVIDKTIYEGELDGVKIQCYKIKNKNSEYYIKKEIADNYLVNAFDFNEWFIDLTKKNGKSKGIICDKKNIYESLNSVNEIKTVIKGDYQAGDFRLLLGSDNRSSELVKIRKKLRTVICKHPLEWDETLFASSSFEEDYRNINRTTAIISKTQSKNLRKSANDTDIWKETGLKKIFSNNEFNFFHPLYFLNYLNKIGMLEFNPYEGKVITTPKDLHQEDNLKKEKHWVGSNGVTFTVADNPGFAPETTENTDYSYAGKFYTVVTGGFKENYTDVMCNSEMKLTYRERDGFTDSNPKYHVGIDFQGKSNNKVISLISGKILAYGLFENFGNVVIVGHSSGKGVYLAAHLSNFNKELLNTGYVSPGDWIGKVGGTGSNGSNDEGKRQYAEHLHVSFFDYKYQGHNIINESNSIVTKGTDYTEMLSYEANPFIHSKKMEDI